jgi:hypothetical protein
MFIRVKRIKGQDYGYLVENSWTEKGTRQRVSSYLGRILRPARVKSETLQGFLNLKNVSEYVRNSSYGEIISALVRLELYNHNSGKIEIDFEKFLVRNKGKNIVVAMNEGFLCNHSLKRLMEYSPEEDYSGFLLADLITAAGIKIEKDVFVALFEKLQRKEAKEQAEKTDFYY